MSLKIEKNVPIPPPCGSTSEEREKKLMLPGLKVNDSVFIPDSLMNGTRAYGVIYGFKKRTGATFVTRTVREPIYGMRIWRTA